MRPIKRRKPSRKKKKRTRPKVCRFCESKVRHLDFSQVDILNRYVTEKGKILPRRITGTCGRHQGMLALAIKRARNLALVP